MVVTTIDNVTFNELQVHGRIDASTVGDFEVKALELASQSTTPILVNFKDVDYVSSAGLRAILKLAKACQIKKIKLGCFNMASGVKEVFKISGFASIISISEDLEQAKAKILG